MKKILIIGDTAACSEQLKPLIENKSYLLIETTTPQKAHNILSYHKIDMIIYCYNDDLDILKKIADKNPQPIIAICSKDFEDDKLAILKAGTDDCLIAPCDMQELLVKMDHLLTNAGQQIPIGQDNILSAERVKFGQWILDRARFQVYDQNHRRAKLTVSEFKILETLVTNPGRTQRRFHLCQVMRENNFSPNQKAIDTKIMRIRKKIKCGDGQKIIQTVHGVGYLYDGPVKPLIYNKGEDA